MVAAPLVLSGMLARRPDVSHGATSAAMELTLGV
jgi:hypothetical protein